MRRTWPIIGVRDVPASSVWYRQLLGLKPEPPGHPDFDQIRDDDEERTVLVCLHEWGGHGEGPPLAVPSQVEPGNGLLLTFLVEDFDDCLERARALGATFHHEPEYPEDWFRSFAVRDPDDYYVAIHSRQDTMALEAKAAEQGAG